MNYLEPIISYGEYPLIETLALHKEKVEQKLRQYGDSPPVFSKYAWCANYHNHFCRENAELDFEDYQIDQSLFKRPIGTIPTRTS